MHMNWVINFKDGKASLILYIGGPHVYSRLEIYEILHNIIGRPPKLAYIPFSVAGKAA